jgi:hypothetical protein
MGEGRKEKKRKGRKPESRSYRLEIKVSLLSLFLINIPVAI